jgi:hypothetical protein
MGDELDDAIANAARTAWQRVLGVDEVALDDDFFELGGHSLSAMRVISIVCHDIGADVGVRVLLDNPELADFVRAVTTHIAAEDGSTPTIQESR